VFRLRFGVAPNQYRRQQVQRAIGS
jgi:hypothetical protein